MYIATGLSPSAVSYTLAADTVLLRTYHKSEGLQPGEYYNFKVIARNAVGDSVYSPVVQVIAATAPNPPDNLSVGSQSTTQIVFSWQ